MTASNRRDPGRPAAAAPPARRWPAALTVVLSAVALLLAAGALGVAVLRPAPTDACRGVAWNAVIQGGDLPAGWSMVSNRVFIDNLGTTVLGPAPSGSGQGPAVYLSLNCYGSDAGLAFRRAHEGALAAGSTDVSLAVLGDGSFAVHSGATGNTTLFIRRGLVVADITAPAGVDGATLVALGRIVDAAMVRAAAMPADASPLAQITPLATPTPVATATATASPSAAASPTAIPTATPGTSPAASATPGTSPQATPAPQSHAVPDLEALLPKQVGSTTLSTQSVLGTTALGNDATSAALIAALQRLGKTAADFEIAAAADAAGQVYLYVFAYRVKGVDSADLRAAIVASLAAGGSPSPAVTQVTMAGRTLTKVASTSAPPVYLYEGTVVFAIQASDDALVGQVLALLK